MTRQPGDQKQEDRGLLGQKLEPSAGEMMLIMGVGREREGERKRGIGGRVSVTPLSHVKTERVAKVSN